LEFCILFEISELETIIEIKVPSVLDKRNKIISGYASYPRIRAG
jgi:hypothetical protein